MENQSDLAVDMSYSFCRLWESSEYAIALGTVIIITLSSLAMRAGFHYCYGAKKNQKVDYLGVSILPTLGGRGW